MDINNALMLVQVRYRPHSECILNMAEHPLGCLLSFDGYIPSDLISVKSLKFNFFLQISDVQIVQHVSSTIHHSFFSLQRFIRLFYKVSH